MASTAATAWLHPPRYGDRIEERGDPADWRIVEQVLAFTLQKTWMNPLRKHFWR